VDGYDWVMSPLNAYEDTVELLNGTTIHLNQRERPHIVLDATGNPAALTNGAAYLNDCDHVFTLAVPINTNSTR
jgi:hypothetical protein